MNFQTRPVVTKLKAFLMLLVSWLNTDFTGTHHQYPHMWGDAMIFVYIHRLGHYLGSKFTISKFLEVFRKVNIFGCVICLDIFGGHR